MVKCPFMSVTVICFEPFTDTVTPISGSPDASFTIPLVVKDWAKHAILATRAGRVNVTLLECLIPYILLVI